jgi:hypothetical protein
MIQAHLENGSDMLTILEARPGRVAVARNTPRIFWPEIHPGTYVDWRERPGDPWVRVFVTTVIHEHDGERVYTMVMVALLDARGQRAMSTGTRTVTGEAIETCIRQPL